MISKPLILRKQAKPNPNHGQSPHGYGKPSPVFNLITFPPDIIKYQVKNSHGYGSDKFSNPQRRRVVLQTGGPERINPGNQMERISPAEQCGHESGFPNQRTLSFDKHCKSGDDGKAEIKNVKNSFCNCLWHSLWHSFSPFRLINGIFDNGNKKIKV